MKDFKYWTDLIYTGWSGLCTGAVTGFLLCFFIFGGDFSFKINWHSFIDLWNTIFKK